jgi:acyl carrier protein
MSDETFNKLRSFVIEESAVDDEEITRDTKIENDLGVTGDDAVDFMVAYGKVFNVDVTEFMAADYFDGEGSEILLGIYRLLTGKKKKKKKILTVGHLEKGIVAGQLNEEVINS